MDGRMGWTAALMVATLMLASALGYMVGISGLDSTENAEDDSSPQEPVMVDDAPLLTMDAAEHPYGVTAFTLSLIHI